MVTGGPARLAALSALTFVAYHVIRVLPVRHASDLMALIVSRVVPFVLKRRKMAKNLSRAFPHLKRTEIDPLRRRIAANFGRLLAEIVHIPAFASGAQGTRITVSGATDYPFVERGPAIFVSAHLGNWELAPIIFTKHDLPLTIIYSRLGLESIDRRLLALRKQTGQTYVEKSEALRACVQALKRGRSIALLADQSVLSGIEVDFFGQPTLFTHLPARMAMKFDVPIIMSEACRVAPCHIEVTLHEPIWPGAMRGEAAERALTQRMARAIEGAIRQHPDQWFCNKRRWRKGRDAISAVEPVADATLA